MYTFMETLYNIYRIGLLFERKKSDNYSFLLVSEVQAMDSEQPHSSQPWWVWLSLWAGATLSLFSVTTLTLTLTLTLPLTLTLTLTLTPGYNVGAGAGC